MSSPQHEVTRLLAACKEGDRDAYAELMPLVYDELRRIAARRLRQERGGHTLQPTALVHEAWLRLGEAVGLPREVLLSEQMVLPGVRFAVDAYGRPEAEYRRLIGPLT